MQSESRQGLEEVLVLVSRTSLTIWTHSQEASWIGDPASDFAYGMQCPPSAFMAPSTLGEFLAVEISSASSCPSQRLRSIVWQPPDCSRLGSTPLVSRGRSNRYSSLEWLFCNSCSYHESEARERSSTRMNNAAVCHARQMSVCHLKSQESIFASH